MMFSPAILHPTHEQVPPAVLATAAALEDVGGLEGLAATIMPVLLVIVLFGGVMMWLFGRRLARPACAVSGLVLGSLAGLVLAEMLRENGAFVIPLMIGAALVGGLLAALLFRVWMGLSGAVLLALVVPAAMIVWQGAPPAEPDNDTAASQVHAPTDALARGDEPSESTEHARRAEHEALPEGPSEALSEAPSAAPEDDDEAGVVPAPVITWLEQLTGVDADEIEELPAPLASQADAEDGESLRDAAAKHVEKVLGRGRERAEGWYEQHRERLAAWWANLSPSARHALFIAAGIGALVGLTLGLAVPYTAAAMQSALSGGILMFVAAKLLIENHAPAWSGVLPQSPRAMLLWLGLITLLGVLLQWTLFHKRTDR